MAVLAGQIVDGKYELTRLIGEGGMGAVYEARHTLTENIVALKLVPATGRTRDAKRFKLEVSAAAKIGHEGIVQMHDAGIDLERGYYYLAMELLKGQSFASWLGGNEATPRCALELLRCAAEIMGAAHTAGVVHRDLKPENLFVLAEPTVGGPTVKVIDFGIARRLDATPGTASGVAMGTLAYMSPEQTRNAKAAGPASDVWSLGVMLYEVLSGRLPFDKPSVPGMIVAISTEPHPPLKQVAPDLPDVVTHLVDHCLAKAPEDRPRDARVLAEALANLGAQVELLARAPSIPSRRPTGFDSRGATALASEPEASSTAAQAPTRPLASRLLTAMFVGSLVASGVTWALWPDAEPPPPVSMAAASSAEPVEGEAALAEPVDAAPARASEPETASTNEGPEPGAEPARAAIRPRRARAARRRVARQAESPLLNPTRAARSPSPGLQEIDAFDQQASQIR